MSIVSPTTLPSAEGHKENIGDLSVSDVSDTGKTWDQHFTGARSKQQTNSSKPSAGDCGSTIRPAPKNHRLTNFEPNGDARNYNATDVLSSVRIGVSDSVIRESVGTDSNWGRVSDSVIRESNDSDTLSSIWRKFSDITLREINDTGKSSSIRGRYPIKATSTIESVDTNKSLQIWQTVTTSAVREINETVELLPLRVRGPVIVKGESNETVDNPPLRVRGPVTIRRESNETVEHPLLRHRSCVIVRRERNNTVEPLPLRNRGCVIFTKERKETDKLLPRWWRGASSAKVESNGDDKFATDKNLEEETENYQAVKGSNRLYLGSKLRQQTDPSALMFNITLNNDQAADNVSHETAATNSLNGHALNKQAMPRVVPHLEDQLDEKLKFSCRENCGEINPFPCGCSPVCVVYGTCCDDIAQSCPHVLQEGRSKFGHLLGADVVCHQDFISKIVSCPEQGHLPENQGKNLSKDLVKDVTTNVNDDNIAILWRSTTEKSPEPYVNSSIYSKFLPREDTHTEVKQTGREKFNMALLLSAPVTDTVSGFTFRNKSIYDCNNMSGDSYFLWPLRLEYMKDTPQSLEDLEHLLSADNRYLPLNQQIPMSHRCHPDVVRKCNNFSDSEISNKEYTEKCKSGTALVYSSLGNTHYANRFCAFCNEGRHNWLILHRVNIEFFPVGERYVRMSTSPTGGYDLELGRHVTVDSHISWISAQCSISGDSTEQNRSLSSSHGHSDQTVCVAQCQEPTFTLRPDGMCKARHVILAAVADDGLSPICPSVLLQLRQFINCSLNHLSSKLKRAELTTSRVSVLLDTRVNKTLYALQLIIHLPTLSTTWSGIDQASEFLTNLNHLAVVAKSLKRYQLSHDLCAGGDPGNETVSPTISTRRQNTAKVDKINEMTWTACASFIFPFEIGTEFNPPPNALRCVDGIAFDQSDETSDALLDLKCYSEFKSQNSGRADSMDQYTEGSAIMVRVDGMSIGLMLLTTTFTSLFLTSGHPVWALMK